MGYIRHDAVIVTTDTDLTGGAVREFVESLHEDARRHVLGPVRALNGYETWVFAPDGSKEGWGTSDAVGDDRLSFYRFAVGLPHTDAVFVAFGGDYGIEQGAAVVADPATLE